jgi:hypothetical protein
MHRKQRRDERKHDNHQYDKPPGNGNATNQPNERGAARGITRRSCDERRGGEAPSKATTNQGMRGCDKVEVW